MQIRDFLEHEWQSIGTVRERIAKHGGVPMPEVALVRVIQRTIPDAIFTPDAKQVRLLPPTTAPGV